MTPQTIKLTRHDGSNVCPAGSEAIVIVVYSSGNTAFGAAEHRLWDEVATYAVIEFVEPDPVIEVGDVVSINWSPSTSVYTVLAIHGGWVWYLAETGHCHTAKLSDLALVRKGGAV